LLSTVVLDTGSEEMTLSTMLLAVTLLHPTVSSSRIKSDFRKVASDSPPIPPPTIVRSRRAGVAAGDAAGGAAGVGAEGAAGGAALANPFANPFGTSPLFDSDIESDIIIVVEVDIVRVELVAGIEMLAMILPEVPVATSNDGFVISNGNGIAWAGIAWVPLRMIRGISV
jgi:hypothetical protein